ncbi:hypothetical protein GCM10010404_55080 [Nonomuraea africana]|uniref:LppX_LprAFG lipoprotein n=1 Tax=Nonomuraea africana TaxID=46171 RepID=A0ABR9KTZ7_9ACTN|nr:hypothetical protein [Nonomuraea africana]MBE1565514.1 hypothetical protein [Nonomuraea africana]
MKHVAIGLALTTGVALITAVPAQAAPKADPVKALIAQLVPGKGVRMSETRKSAKNGKTYAIAHEKGKIAFSRRGIAATDKSEKIRPLRKMDADEAAFFQPSREIVVGKTVYRSGGIWTDELPDGKRWLRIKGFGPSSSNSPIEVLDPQHLRVLLAHATFRRDGTAGGVTTTCRLEGLAEANCPYKDFPKISWTLWFDSRGLVTRLVSRHVVHDTALSAHVDVRYTGWGSTVVIDPPPADQVWDPQEEADTPADPLDESTS